jgi:hypothetical protein
VCNADDRCVATTPFDGPHDGPIDAPPDAMIDARQAALTCVDPGTFPPAGGTAMETTAGGVSRISSMCGGFVMNGADDVYRISAAAGDQYLVTITGALRAYVITPCSLTPSTPICLGNSFASAGNPISVTTTFAGGHYVVVDHESPSTSGTYTLTVTRQ